MTQHLHQEIENKFSTMWKRLEEHLKQIENGDLVKIEGLEQETKNLCEKLTELPKEEAVQYQPRLEQLIEKFNELSGKLTTAYNVVKDEISELNRRKQAQNAYGKGSILSKASSSKDNKSDEEYFEN